MTNHIVLFEPLMPANTGNIARTCAGTDTVLDLIKPLGFSVDDKHLKRAGLDYWDKVQINYHDNLPAFLKTVPNQQQMFLVSKFGKYTYTDHDYSNPNQDYYFVFGKETTGLPEKFEQKYAEQAVRIPQDDSHIRALNLSNTCAIVIYEALRQQQFNGLAKIHNYQHDKLKDFKK
ncbi:tRNA (uridine(34)/cytosine(34)/5-carboxymethylaminomethyluridine(34)-2'-O)-methyltransferase TrmL [Fructilactobacillus lindneri]|uniref:Putative tRNA (cytidine(34)-2'-O)-methyltransferase n=2 Tax=Fructilactobacillus lindneri TaxID=53444 RepID=A0A0R2JR76_9LACO|nr:tRNA (cytidine(34)-2'-O)-methyltransferase [Fructilactobacillus lindneri]ANZ57999.1 RNA methyltransferase [Fructilactobacillus lindneri]ANZ59269.1 RNA methyltransferase [Fructilactobacillus lindneri]KRN78374.1 tRNA rRNA methyltransferase [Fructilactobacillus lindneri DSM 20690 = JCM 11027]POG98894.1 tRNA (uridine(34)/cytosine(34)/5-carboxymethylaminomethyluridine(34)-2'-O)-methyltransferase TrmL [Fructilactobacillus lindneri]POH00151.1 tRNA (uridine(34)/cytosine(34)/5-carboxymethylaminometh